MNEQITVNFENLSEKERNKLMSLIEKANTPPQKWWKGTEFDIHNNDRFYTVAHNSSVYILTNKNWTIDKEAISFGNACKDKSYMEQRAKEIKLDNLIHNFAHVVNEGWTPNWDNKNEIKWYIYYDYNFEKYETFNYCKVKDVGAVYFKSKEAAQRCIDEIIIPFEKGEL